MTRPTELWADLGIRFGSLFLNFNHSILLLAMHSMWEVKMCLVSVSVILAESSQRFPNAPQVFAAA